MEERDKERETKRERERVLSFFLFLSGVPGFFMHTERERKKKRRLVCS